MYREVLSDIYEEIERSKKEKLTWKEFLDELQSEPEKIIRNIYQYISDLLCSTVGEGEDENPNDPENINFVYYDTSYLFERTHEPFFPDRLFSNKFMNLFSNLNKSKQNKIYIIDGPHGSGKSTFMNNFLYSLEEFSKTEEGLLYSILWMLDTDKLGSVDIPESYVEIPCPSNDNPLLLIPSKYRAEFLNKILPESESKEKLFYDKEYEWIFRKEPCALCNSIFEGILDKTGSSEDVFDMVYARRFNFNKQTGRGITVYNPSDELRKTKVKSDENIQNKLDEIFSDRKIEYKYSEFAEVNNGIYGLMDIIDNNEYRFNFLHGLVSEGLHKVENIEETSESIFLVASNHIENHSSMSESFIDRIEEIFMNYILDVDTQKKVYFNKFGRCIQKYFLPEVLENLTKVIISTRLKTENTIKKEWVTNPKKYKNYCDDNLDLLKISIYGGEIPQWIDETDRKNFTRDVRKKIIDNASNEGRFGLSERESINIFWDFFNKYASEDEYITMENVKKYFENLDNKNIKQKILNAVEKAYDYTILQQIKESLYHYNTDKIVNDILNYLCALNYDFHEKVHCISTEDVFIMEPEFLQNVEKYIIGNLGSKETKDFRMRCRTRYISETLQKGEKVENSDQFKELYDRYVYNIKSRSLRPFLKNETFRQAIKEYNTPQFHSYDEKIKGNIEFLMNNLQNYYGYDIKGAQQICIYVIDNEVAERFEEKSDEEEPESSYPFDEENEDSQFGF